MMNFDDINFGPAGGPKPFDKCPEPFDHHHHHHMIPPCDVVDKRLYDFIVHVDGVAHKALEVAGSASLEASTAKRLAEQSLKILNKVAAIANKSNTKADKALADLSVLKDDFVRLLTELNKTQEGAGLASDGKYIKNTEANYIAEATNLADADNKLDAALKETNDTVATLNGEVEDLQEEVAGFEEQLDQLNAVQSNIIGAVGLKETGKYQKGTNSIINTAKSVLEADEMLAEAIGELADEVEAIQDAAEGLDALQEQVDTNTSDIAALKAKDIELKRDIDQNSRDIATNANNIAANTSSISANAQAITAANTRVSTVERRVDLLDSKMDPTHALAEQANQRVSVVEGRVDTLAGNVTTLQGNVASLQDGVAANAADITALETSVGNIVLSKTGELEYTLMVNNTPAGKINIPEDQFLSHVDYNPQTKEITFTFADGTVLSPIYIGDLIDTYTAGNGIEISGNQVSAKVDSQSEPFLSVTTGGLKLSGIQTAIDKRYQAGLGLKRSAQPNSEGEYTFDVQIQENSRPYLSADVDGIGLNLNALAEAIGNDFDPSELAGEHLTYNSTTGKLDVNVASLVADPAFVTAITDIVNNALLWEVKDASQIQPKNGKSIYVDGTIDATGAIYSGE